MDDSGEFRPSDTGEITDEEVVEKVEEFEIAEDLDYPSESENQHSRAIDIPKVTSEIKIDAGYVPPNSEIIEKIVAQVEFYFSDVNLPSDKFLMQRIKRDKKGFVSVRLINGFNKMKKLGVSDNDVTYALKTSSTQLQLNSSGKKLKRILPIPRSPPPVETIEDPLKRTVLAINLEVFKEESVRQVFEQCGKVEEINLLTAQSQLSSTISTHIKRHFKFNLPEEWALIRYNTREVAERACRNLTNTADWRKGLRVSLLIVGGRKSQKNHHEEPTKSKLRVMQLSKDESTSNSAGSDVDSNSEGVKIVKTTCGRRSGGKYGRSPLAYELDESRMRSSSFDTDRPAQSNSPANNSSSSSPWIQRRRLEQINTGSSPNILSSSPLKTSGEALKKLDNILRLPRGPEGKGFEIKRYIVDLNLNDDKHACFNIMGEINLN